MDYRFNLFKENKNYDITSLVGNISRRSSIEALGEELSFDKATSKFDKLFPNIKIEAGNGIVMSSKKEIFRGVIVDENQGGLNQSSYVAFDYAFYLNKSTETIQYNKVRADEAIKKLCSKFNIPIGNITPIRALIDKIYKNVAVSDIIKDILQLATDELKIKYRIEMREGKFYIEPYSNLIVKAYFKPAFNVQEFDVTKVISNFSRTKSIADMKNSVVIVSDDEKSSKVIATAKDEKNIKKYGLLQLTESVDKKDISKSRNIAKNKLEEFNKVIETMSLELIGDDIVRAGRILEINEPLLELKNYYLVTECTHSYNNNHKMALSLESIKI